LSFLFTCTAVRVDRIGEASAVPTSPSLSLSERRDVRHVMPSVPGVEAQHL
jgi:hypothetical protein